MTMLRRDFLRITVGAGAGLAAPILVAGCVEIAAPIRVGCGATGAPLVEGPADYKAWYESRNIPVAKGTKFSHPTYKGIELVSLTSDVIQQLDGIAVTRAEKEAVKKGLDVTRIVRTKVTTELKLTEVGISPGVFEEYRLRTAAAMENLFSYAGVYGCAKIDTPHVGFTRLTAGTGVVTPQTFSDIQAQVVHEIFEVLTGHYRVTAGSQSFDLQVEAELVGGVLGFNAYSRSYSFDRENGLVNISASLIPPIVSIGSGGTFACHTSITEPLHAVMTPHTLSNAGRDVKRIWEEAGRPVQLSDDAIEAMFTAEANWGAREEAVVHATTSDFMRRNADSIGVPEQEVEIIIAGQDRLYRRLAARTQSLELGRRTAAELIELYVTNPESIFGP
ncbi:hypothetical protein HYT84_02210 [Candidatus Micrarchaeota archaeon]|nr:hypothetical protein [Candidatus Micrarchaeota archaeon]